MRHASFYYQFKNVKVEKKIFTTAFFICLTMACMAILSDTGSAILSKY